jgi:tRNA/tmRNA/rRNA uracil-C5-methylase (TrmA/RlmC/RlmD family)
MRNWLFTLLLTGFIGMIGCESARAQNNQEQTQLKVKQLIEKKAEYHRLTSGEQYGYRIKIHFDVDRDKAKAARAKFSEKFPDYPTDEEYQQPYWVVLIGNFKTKLQAYESLKKIHPEFSSAFIVKAKIRFR